MTDEPTGRTRTWLGRVKAKRTLLIVFLVVVLLGLGGYFTYQRQQAQAVEAAQAALRTEIVRRGDLESTVSATGPISAENQVNLRFESAGTVAEVKVEVGDQVTQGQVLARLDTDALARAVAQAGQALVLQGANLDQLKAGPTEADVRAAKAAVTSARVAYEHAQAVADHAGDKLVIAQASLDKAAERLKNAQWAYDQLAMDLTTKDRAPHSAQAEALANAQTDYDVALADFNLKQLDVGASGLDSAYAQLSQAQANLDKLQAGPTEAQLRASEAQVEQARLSLESAQANLAKATLLAPFAGLVGAVNIRAGEAPGADPAVVLVDVSKYHIDVLVDEVDVARVAVGQPVTIALDALPGTQLAGRVDRIAPVATVSSGVVSYSVRLVLAPTEAPLRVGMSATAEIVAEKAENALLVPNWTIRRDRETGKTFVSLVQGDQLEEIEVVLGLRNDQLSEVRSGLNDGDVVGVSTEREKINLFGGG